MNIKLTRNTLALFDKEACALFRDMADKCAGKCVAAIVRDGRTPVGHILSDHLSGRYAIHGFITNKEYLAEHWTGNFGFCRRVSFNPESSASSIGYGNNVETNAWGRNRIRIPGRSPGPNGETRREIMAKVLCVADPTALAAARKFDHHFTEAAYIACAVFGERMVQFSETFPMAFVALFHPWSAKGFAKSIPVSTAQRAWLTREAPGRKRAIEAVVNGEKLREVAKAAHIPLTWRNVRQDLAAPFLAGLAHFLPALQATASLPGEGKAARKMAKLAQEMSYQVTAGRNAVERLGPVCAWFAKELSRKDIPESLDIEAIRYHEIMDYILAEETFGVRRFTTSQRIEKVMERSIRWHDVLRRNARVEHFECPSRMPKPSDGNVPLAVPWKPAGRIDDLDFVPLVTKIQLVEESAVMRHCVRTYGHKVASGVSQIYSIRCENNPVATMEVGRSVLHPNRLDIVQISGLRNTRVDKSVVDMARKFLVA